MEKLIEFKNVTKRFGNHEVLKNFNLSISRGEFVAIVGSSGSGKSTVLNMMGLLEPASSGQIKIMGKRIPKLNSYAATKIRRTHINYLFQSYALIDEKTVEDNLLLALHFVNLALPEKLLKIKKILQQLGISKKQKVLVETLSGGEKQRVALARALIKPCDIILADEPTGALDPQHSENAFELILAMQKQYHKTIVMVTHNRDQARRTDRLIEL